MQSGTGARRPGPAARAAGGLALVLALVLPGAAPAQDTGWIVTGSLNQRFSGDTNIRLDAASDGFVFGSTTSLGLSVRRQTPRSRFSAATSLAWSLFTGDRSEDLGGLSVPSLRLGHGYRGLGWSVSSSMSLAIRPATFARLEEIFVPAEIDPDAPPPDPDVIEGETILDSVDQDVLRLDLSASSSLSLQLDPRNSVRFGVNASTARFLEEAPGLSETLSIGLSTGWNRRLSPGRSAGLGLTVRRFVIDGTTDSRSLSFGVNASFSQQLTGDSSFSVTLGGNLVNQTRDVILGGIPVETTDSSGGFNGSASLRLALTQTTSLSLNASQGLSASVAGELQTRSQVGLSLSHRINSRQSAGIRLGIARFADVDGGDAGHTLSLAPNFNWQITPVVTGTLGYSFRLADDAGDLSFGHTVFVTLSRSLDILR